MVYEADQHIGALRDAAGMKWVICGLEGSGKSLYLATVAVNVLERNKRWAERGGAARPLVSNLKFAPEVEEEYKGFIKYWSDPKEIIGRRDCDIIWDEISTDLDAQSWADQPRSLKRWLRQSMKVGVELYATAQEFADVDIAFRRRVHELFYVSKVIGSPRPSATRPEVRRIWGVCMIRALQAHPYDEEERKTEGLPKFLLISRKKCEIFDTTQEIKPGEMPQLDHIERECPDCGYKQVRHK